MARYKKRVNKGTIFAIVVALLCAVAIELGVFTDWYKDFSKFKPKSSNNNVTANADDIYAPDAGLLISQTTENGIMLYSAPTRLADFTTYSLDENVEAVKTITARFTPADTTLQKVDYTAAWKNEASEWATGKVVTDYITLTQSSDGSLDCAVSLIDAIGEQIIITCTARPLEEGDWVPSATCTVDYYKRITDCKVTFHGTCSDPDSGDTAYDYSEVLDGKVLKYENISSAYVSGYDYEDYADVDQIRSTGTIYDSVNNSTVNIKVSISDSIADKIKTAAGVSSLGSYNLVTNGISQGFLMKTAINTILGGETTVNNHRNAIYTAFKEVYDNGQSAFTFEISFTTGKGQFSHVFKKENLFNPTALGVKATDVDLDTPGIIFSIQYEPGAILSPVANY